MLDFSKPLGFGIQFDEPKESSFEPTSGLGFESGDLKGDLEGNIAGCEMWPSG